MAQRGAGDDGRERRVGPYLILRRLSAGGLVEIYLARREAAADAAPPVALKVMLPDARGVDAPLERARLAATLQHPNVARVLEAGLHRDTGELFLAMEYVAGQTLSAIVRRARERGERLTPEFVFRVVHDAALGLHAAHGIVDAGGAPRPLIHGAVSCVTLMVSYAGTVRVVGLNLAPRAGASLDVRADVEALGAALWEALSGDSDVAPVPDDVATLARSVQHCATALEVAQQLADGRALADDAALRRVMEALFPEAPAPSDFAPDAEVSVAPASVEVAPAPRLERPGSRWRRGLRVAAPVVLVALGLGLALGHEPGASTEVETPPPPSSLLEGKSRLLLRMRVAIETGDFERAHRLASDCDARLEPCAEARAMLAAPKAVEAERAQAALREGEAPTVTAPDERAGDSAPRCVLDQAGTPLAALDVDAATAALRGCVTATGLDPRAEAALRELARSPSMRRGLLDAQRALEAGEARRAREILGLTPHRGIWTASWRRLEARARAAPRSRPGSGPAAEFTTPAAAALARGDVDEAVAALRRCVDALPGSSECVWRLAHALERAEDVRGSYEMYGRFLEMASPSDPRFSRVSARMMGYARGAP